MGVIFNEEQKTFILNETVKLLDNFNVTYEVVGGSIVADEKYQATIDGFGIHAKARALMDGVITQEEFSNSIK